MNFERGRPANVSLGIGNLGRRNLYIKWPYVYSTDKSLGSFHGQYHISEFVDVLNNWYKKEELGIAIFGFPAPRGQDRISEFVVTAAPGEETHYNSIYRKINYDEIFSRFFKIFNTQVRFKLWLYNTNEHLAQFLKVVEVP